MKILKTGLLIFLSVIPCSLFAGIMIAGSLAALIPQVDYVAYPFLSTHGNKVVPEKWQFALPGEERFGTTHLLVDSQGNKKDITFRVTVYAALIYTFILMLASLAAAAISMMRRKIPFNEIIGQAVIKSALVCLTTLGGIAVIAILFFAFWIVKQLLASW